MVYSEDKKFLNLGQLKSCNFPYMTVTVLGRGSIGDGLGGDYLWKADSVLTANDEDIIAINGYDVGRYILIDSHSDVKLLDTQSNTEAVGSTSRNNRDLTYSGDMIQSSSDARVAYEDTTDTIIIEEWDDLSNWSTSSNVQVSDNKLYSGGSGGASSGINRSFALNDNETMRAVMKCTLPTGLSSGGLIIGVSKDSEGGVPVNAGGNAYGLYLTAGPIKQIVDGAFLDLENPQNLVIGYSYNITITVDANYISVVANCVEDEEIEYAMRAERPANINNIFIFNSDTRALTGSYVHKFGARKSLSSIFPRNDIEGITDTVQWTGDMTNNFKIYLPSSYDSRKPQKAIICFHGLGTDETQWSINHNMRSVQKKLVSDGNIVVTCCPVASKTTWGNELTTNAYYEAYKYLRDNYSISNVGIYANSMGGIESLNAIAIERIPCSVWVGTAPTTNLRNNYDNELFTPTVTNAYGISGNNYNEKTEGRDPYLNDVGDFRGLPMLFIAAEDDAAVSTSENTGVFYDKIEPSSIEAVRVVVPDSKGGHSFYVDDYLETISEFYKKHLHNI